MRAVVLVGGEGTRLRPLTFTTPKGLLPIANQPFLERQLSWLSAHGVDEVILSMGYLPDAFERHFPEGRYDNVKLRYAVEDELLGTAGAIRYASDGISDRFVVCNGDGLTSLDLRSMVEFHDARGAEATISLARVEDPSAFGVVPTREDGQVIAFVEKPPAGKAPTNWINSGTYVLEPSFLDRIPPRLKTSVEYETFPRMLEQPGFLYAYASDDYWVDIGTPEKYLQAHADVLGGCLGLPPVAGARSAGDQLWVQDGATIDEGAVVAGPSLVGVDARVGSGAVVHRSTLGAGATVGAGARVERSVLHDGVHVHAGTHVIDSVVGAHSVLEREVVLTDQTVVGASTTITAGTRISGGRVASGGSAEEAPSP